MVKTFWWVSVDLPALCEGEMSGVLFEKSCIMNLDGFFSPVIFLSNRSSNKPQFIFLTIQKQLGVYWFIITLIMCSSTAMYSIAQIHLTGLLTVNNQYGSGQICGKGGSNLPPDDLCISFTSVRSETLTSVRSCQLMWWHVKFKG